MAVATWLTVTHQDRALGQEKGFAVLVAVGGGPGGLGAAPWALQHWGSPHGQGDDGGALRVHFLPEQGL